MLFCNFPTKELVPSLHMSGTVVLELPLWFTLQPGVAIISCNYGKLHGYICKVGSHNHRCIWWHPFWPSVHPRPHSPPYPKGGISYCGENTVAGGNRGDHFSVPCSNSIWRRRGQNSIFWPENHLWRKSEMEMVICS